MSQSSPSENLKTCIKHQNPMSQRIRCVDPRCLIFLYFFQNLDDFSWRFYDWTTSSTATAFASLSTFKFTAHLPCFFFHQLGFIRHRCDDCRNAGLSPMKFIFFLFLEWDWCQMDFLWTCETWKILRCSC